MLDGLRASPVVYPEEEVGREMEQGRNGGGWAYSFVVRPSHLTVDHASISRRSIVPTPDRDTFNVWALITLFLYIT